MVSIVESSNDTRQTLLYNELKLAERKAVFLGALNYWQEDSELGFEDKLRRLRDLTVLNERVHAHTIHFSINFHPDDQLTDKQMRLIAKQFLKQIDFGDQPALLYRHLDAGHPHAHIVTVNIASDGHRIPNDKRAPVYMEKICAGLEQQHDLVPAIPKQTLRPDQALRFGPPVPARQTPAQRLHYGQIPTKTGISAVLDHLLDKFAYTTLDELNAVLSLYNVRADRGSEQGLMYRNKGLYYRMIDENGKNIGAPIKASSFLHHPTAGDPGQPGLSYPDRPAGPVRPTLSYIEQNFVLNKVKQAQYLESIRGRIDWTLVNYTPSCLNDWKEELVKEHIALVTAWKPNRRNYRLLPSDDAYNGHGFFYVDFYQQTVCRDTSLGSKYTAKAILKRTGLEEVIPAAALRGELTLDQKETALLERLNPDPAESLQLLLKLSRRHDQVQILRQAEMLKQADDLRQSHRLRLRL